MIAQMRKALGRRREERDAGFSLLEGVVAALVLLVLSTAMIGLLIRELTTSRDGRERVAASTLAARELEITRNQFNQSTDNMKTIVNAGVATNPDPLNGVAGSASVLNGVPYTITRSVEWLPVGNGASACDGGSLVTYPSVRVHVQVTWPNMGTTQPVVNDTLLTPVKSVTSSSSAGYLAVKVTDHLGQPNQGRRVTVSGPAGTFVDLTDGSGCAVFRLTTAGTYTYSLGEPGYVDYYGNPTPSNQQLISLGQLQVVPMTYDVAASLTPTFVTAAGYSLPVTLPPVTIANSGLQTNPQGTESFPVTNPNGNNPAATLGSLWPFKDGYSVWGGDCVDSDPAASPSNGTRPAATVVAPGATASPQITLGPVTVKVVHPNGTPATNVQVAAVKTATTLTTQQEDPSTPGFPVADTADNTAGCNWAPETTQGSSSSPFVLGTTDSTGTLNTSVPYGSWHFQVVSPAVAKYLPTSTVVQPQQATAPTSYPSVQITLTQ